MVLQITQSVQWANDPLDASNGHSNSTSQGTTSSNPSPGDKGRGPLFQRQIDEHQSHGDCELAWTKIYEDLQNEAEYPDQHPATVAPAADPEASDVDSHEEAKKGLDYLQVVETDDAHDAVANWPIKAIGRRPVDYLGRELLHGSLLRDHRPRFFHNYASNPADWMLSVAPRFADDRRFKIAVQHLALHFLHRRHLLHRIDDQRELGDFADERECALLADLWTCTPYGVQVGWDGGQERTVGKCCHHAWYCPWCFGRRIVNLYERLKKGPLRQPAGKHLVLGRVYVPGNLLDRIGDDLNPAESRALRMHLGGHMRNQLERLGVSGGLLSYQLGPTLRDDSPRGHFDTGPTRSQRVPTLQHELAVLGEIELKGEGAEAHLIRQLEKIKLGTSGCGDALRNEWVVMLAEQKESLRLLLVGCGARFDLDRVRWFRSQDTDYLARKGIWGAFALQPLFMLDERQWQFYRMAVDGMHLYDLFGSWRRLARRDEDPIMTEQQRAFLAINGRKRREVIERRGRLLKVVKSFGLPSNEGLSSSSGRRGRPGKVQQIAGLLMKHQVAVSDRDLRWLSKVLVDNGADDGFFVRTGNSQVERENML